MLKLTKETVTSIMARRPVECTKEELQAIMKLFGFQIKEYSFHAKEDSANNSVHFEIHYRREYIVDVDAGSMSAISFGNEWVNWGEGTSGVCIPVDNMKEFILILINLFVDKLRVDYDGPQYDERKDYEYKTMKELSLLLEHAKDILSQKESKPRTKKGASQRTLNR